MPHIAAGPHTGYTHNDLTKVANLKPYPPAHVKPGDIVFVGNRLMRILVTGEVRKDYRGNAPASAKKKIRRILYEGINVRTGKTIRFFKKNVRYKSPMSPLEPTVSPLPQAIGLHDGCGGTVLYSRTRRIGDRYCNRCRADGRYGRPRPILDSEANPIGREPSRLNSVQS